jgi:hypothetical protein
VDEMSTTALSEPLDSWQLAGRVHPKQERKKVAEDFKLRCELGSRLD